MILKNSAQYRLKNLIAEVKSKEVWGGFRFETEDDNLRTFFDNLEQDNDLLKIFKTVEKHCSIYGTGQVYFDTEDKVTKLGVYKPNPENTTIKIEGLEEVASIGIRLLLKAKNGYEISVKEFRTPDYVKRLPYSGVSAGNFKVPIDGNFFLAMPEDVIKYGATMEDIELNYNGVLSSKEFLNKDIVDYEDNSFMLPDTFNAEDHEKLLIEMIEYMEQERKYNKSYMTGNINNQDLALMEDSSNVNNTLSHLTQSGLVDKTLHQFYKDRFFDPSQALVESRFFINSNGSSNDIKFEKGDFKLKEVMEGYNALMTAYFTKSGLDYSLIQGGGVKSITEIQASMRNTFETIKATNLLRTKQWEEFFERVMRVNNIDPDAQKGKWKFIIISNIPNNTAETPEGIKTLMEAGVMSLETAVGKVNPEWDKHQIQDEIERIGEEKKHQLEEQAEFHEQSKDKEHENNGEEV